MKDKKITKPYLVLGILLVILALLLNEWTLAHWFSRDDFQIVHVPTRILIWFFDLNIVAWGVYFIVARKIDFRNIAMSLFSYMLIFFIIFCFDFFLSYTNVIKLQSIHPWPIYRPSDLLGWEVKPNVRYQADGLTVETGPSGHRKTNPHNAEAEFNIYFFGDSFTFGDQVGDQDTFPAQVADLLKNQKINVINCGVSGYGLPQMFQSFLMMESQIRENDIIIFTPISYDVVRTGQNIDYVGSFIFQGKGRAVRKFPIFEKHYMVPRNINTLANKFRFLAINTPIMGVFFSKFYATPNTSLNDADKIFRLIQDKLKRKNARFVLSFIPASGTEIRGKYAVDISRFDFVDMRKAFQQPEVKLQDYFFVKVGHCTKAGNSIVAKFIVQYLAEHGWIERCILPN